MNTTKAIAAIGGPSAAAERLGVSRETIHRWMRAGMARALTVHTIELAAAAGCSVYDLAGHSVSRSSTSSETTSETPPACDT